MNVLRGRSRKVLAAGIALLALFHAVYAEVKPDFDGILARSGLKRQHLGILVTDESGTIFTLNENKQFIPASLTKILTAGAALELLGPRFQFKTQLLTDSMQTGNTLKGSLYLKAGGDPGFGLNELLLLMRKFSDREIRIITGNLVIDDTRFEDRRVASWSAAKALARSWRGDSSALFVNMDPPVRKIFVSKARDLVVYLNMTQPNLLTGYKMAYLFRKTGILLEGGVTRGAVPANAKVLAEVSTPLTSVVSEMLKSSNNYSAEVLTMNLAAERMQKVASPETGLDSIRQFMDSLGIPREDYRLTSGAGYSHQNLISPATVCYVLDYLKHHYDSYPSFLSVAGVDGTLKHRMRKTSAQGRIVAKTGYLEGVVGLAGFVPRADGNTLTFTFIYNGPVSPRRVRAAFDKMCIELAK